MSVSAKDKASGKSQSVRIEASTQLSKEEVEKLKNEAAVHASEDSKKKELIEVKNQAEQIIYLAEKSLRDLGDKVSADIKEGVNKKIEALKSVKDGSDVEAIKSTSTDLSNEIQKIGQRMYNNKKDDNTDDNAGGPQQQQQDSS